jgi:hypothetical protein
VTESRRSIRETFQTYSDRVEEETIVAVRIYLTILLLLLAAPAVRAGIRPSFNIESSAWFATHVVVVTEGEKIDGNLTVLESWKGDLAPGEVISVPELAAFSAKASRLIRKPIWDRSTEPEHYVTGDRMVLFLKEKPRAKTEGEESVRDRSWASANQWGGMDVSVLWVEGEKTYAFIQVMNPGASILIDYGKSEGEMNKIFSEIDADHASLERAAAVKDPAARAEALEPFTAHEVYLASEAAFEGLRGCGRAALPTLRRLLLDETKLKMHEQVIETMSEIGGEDVGEELTRVVGEELTFWKATAPGLSKDWWNHFNVPETEDLRDRYSKLYAALLGLKKLKHAGSYAVVAELRDYWRSLPQLDDGDEENQITTACNELLGARGNSPAKR